MTSTEEECAVLQSPVGWLRICADGVGVTSIEFLEEVPVQSPSVSYPHLKMAYRQLQEYFSGERLDFTFPLNPKGTKFQKTVWQSLREVPFGATVTYKDLARRMGRPLAARAVGRANNQNPLPIVVPCHRVVGKGGDLVGYASGLGIKQSLLAHEGVEL